jgi:hypothetical protein
VRRFDEQPNVFGIALRPLIDQEHRASPEQHSTAGHALKLRERELLREPLAARFSRQNGHGKIAETGRRPGICASPLVRLRR